MYKEGWSRDLHVRWAKILEYKNEILVTERNNYLTKINLEDGTKVWTVKIMAYYDWIKIHNDKIYCLNQMGLLKIINFTTGELEKEHDFGKRYLGYVILNDNYLITGSWRGYTDLMCLKNDKNFSFNWQKSTKSEMGKSYSIPIIDKNDLFFLSNSDQNLTKIDLKDGKELWKIDLPNKLNEPDLGYNFQIDKGEIIIYSKCGKIYKLDMKILEWKLEIQHSCGIMTSKPQILDNQYLFRDVENFICSYDILTKEIRWKVRSNHANYEIVVAQIDQKYTLIGLTMKRQIIIDEAGNIVKELKAEKRYGSGFTKIDEKIYYLTKSRLKQLIPTNN